eukprot:scaffold2738_cov314-Pinguiococcus_pyrenoidosus.AAC.5
MEGRSLTSGSPIVSVASSPVGSFAGAFDSDALPSDEESTAAIDSDALQHEQHFAPPILSKLEDKLDRLGIKGDTEDREATQDSDEIAGQRQERAEK